MTVLSRRSAPGGGVYRAAGTDHQSRLPIVDPHMHEALTDLHAYVLALDAERERMGNGVNPLSKFVFHDGVELARLRAEIADELSAVRTMLTTLRACADPEGTLL